MPRYFYCILILLSLIFCSLSYTSVAPTWVTSNYMRAGSQDVIATLTGSSTDPTFIFTFSSPLPGVPNLAYGIKRYRGADTIREENFQIRKLSLNASAFKVIVDIIGSTNIYTLNVPYLAVDPTFPHHLNSFDNVPVNYGKTLTNITSKSMSKQTFFNDINYTAQAAGRTYKTFTDPLSSNKILLYITALQIWATGYDIIWGYYPVDLKVGYSITNANIYRLTVDLSVYVEVDKLQFSMIVFNSDDVEKSKKYVIVYSIWQTTSAGGFIEVPSAFVDNFILGLTDFSTKDGKCVIVYQWAFATVSSAYGVQLAVSTPVNNNYDCALTRMKSTVFYMKTWQCQPSNPYFNLTTNLCQDDCGLYFYKNTTALVCLDCEFGCVKCTNSTVCTQCDSAVDHRTLTTVNGKATCLCSPGYYQDPANAANRVCLACIANCYVCTNSTACVTCNEVGGYILTTTKTCKKCGYGCLNCNQTPYTCLTCKTGMTYNSVTQKCVCLDGTYPSTTSVDCLACHSKCKTCKGPLETDCLSCNSAGSYPYYNSTSGACMASCGLYFYGVLAQTKCVGCPFACSECQDNATCTGCSLDVDHRVLSTNEQNAASCVCAKGYFQDPANATNKVCIKCPLEGCLDCNQAATCLECDEVKGYTLTTKSTCFKCGYGCAQCDQAAAKCVACKEGFWMDDVHGCHCNDGTYPSTQAIECLTCNPKCGTCTGPSQTQCKSCNKDSQLPYFNQTTASCQSSCGEYFYEDLLQVACAKCPVGCVTCKSPTECLTCNKETDFRELKTFDEGSSCQCLIGYYQDIENAGNKVCLKCTMENCVSCSSADHCNLCTQKFALTNDNKCLDCGFGCDKCDQTNNKCTACKVGFSLSSDNKCLCNEGTYPSTNSVGCLACNPVCKTCTGPSQTQCKSCNKDSQLPYFNETASSCQNSCGEYFYQNLSQVECSKCPVGCVGCRSSTQCLTCNKETDFRELKTSGEGSLCQCMVGYYQDTENANNRVCLKCMMENCVSCRSAQICESCTERFALTTGNICLDCGFGCERCDQVQVKCTSCKTGFSLSTDNKCLCNQGTYPSTTSVACLACNAKCKTCTGPSQTNCLSCSPLSQFPYFNSTTNSCMSSCGLYHFQNVTSSQCQRCQYSCKKCISSGTCSQCDLENDHRKLSKMTRTCVCAAGYYQDPNDQSNRICLKCIDNCVRCKDGVSCEACNELDGYTLAKQTGVCVTCGFGCQECDGQLKCLSCKEGFDYDNSTKQCQCPKGTVKSATSVTCTTCHPKCKTCSGASQYQCQSCHQSQNRVQLKQPNGLIRCICNPFNYIEPTDSSLTCLKKSQVSCDYGYIYLKEKKSCVEICGDGKNLGAYACDDGNRVDGDGCSKTCEVEQGFDCRVDSGKETCVYVGVVNITDARAYKSPFKNSLTIQCQLEPIKPFFYTLDWKAGLMLIGPKMKVVQAWMEEKWLTINADYFEDLTGKNLTIKYSSSLAPKATGTVNRTWVSEEIGNSRRLFDSVFAFDLTLRDYELPIAPVNNLKPSYFEETTYSTVQKVQKALFIVGVVTISIVVVGLALKTAVPFWQLLFSLQILFLSLGALKEMNPILSGLTQFSVIKGIRSKKIYFESLQSPNQVIEYNISNLGYVSSFFGNMNIMIFLQIAFIILAGAFYLMSKKDLAMQFAFQFVKRMLLLFVLFNAMNLCFSLGLISSASGFQIAVACITTLILIIQIFNFIRNLKYYYYVDRTFDLTNRKIKWLLLGLIVCRLLQALMISVLRRNTMVSISVILAIQLLMAGMMSYARPYRKKAYNVMNIIAEWVVAVFLLISLMVNTQAIGSLETENVFAIFQVSLNVSIVLLMVICFGYSLYRDFCKKRYVQGLELEIQSPTRKPAKTQFNKKKDGRNKDLDDSREKFQFRVEDVGDSLDGTENNISVFIQRNETKFLTGNR